MLFMHENLSGALLLSRYSHVIFTFFGESPRLRSTHCDCCMVTWIVSWSINVITDYHHSNMHKWHCGKATCHSSITQRHTVALEIFLDSLRLPDQTSKELDKARGRNEQINRLLTLTVKATLRDGTIFAALFCFCINIRSISGSNKGNSVDEL